MAVAVIGAGNFGTVIANIIATNGVPTYLWMRDEELLGDIRLYKENRRYLPGTKLSDNLIFTSDASTAVRASELVILSVPSSSFRDIARVVGAHFRPHSFAVSTTKGVELEGFKMMSQILHEELPMCSVGVLSGPNLAVEIASGLYAGTVIASEDEALCEYVQKCLSSASFRVYSSSDVYGVELGGTLKNIYAIICGIASGLKVGQNALAMVITRSLAEMGRFAEAIGANPYTFLGLSGVGDLVATCTSPDSRNFQLGYQIASGLSLDASEKMGKLAEGVNTVKAVFARKGELNLYMPLADALYRVLFDRASLDNIIAGLMTAEQTVDVEFVNRPREISS